MHKPKFMMGIFIYNIYYYYNITELQISIHNIQTCCKTTNILIPNRYAYIFRTAWFTNYSIYVPRNEENSKQIWQTNMSLPALYTCKIQQKRKIILFTFLRTLLTAARHYASSYWYITGGTSLEISQLLQVSTRKQLCMAVIQNEVIL